ncbi:MAG: hypothetical protein P4L43_20025 [Syntrophobacteraceae bacterium]|nr:hypothetical protein [Syntrophobacteraceae bacterium]
MGFRNEETVGERIAMARCLYSKWGDELRRDPEIAARTRELSTLIKASSVLSSSSGVTNECRICEEEDGGSCCGAGIEDGYGSELLLLNLLLGAVLPGVANSAGSCHFLGETGCVLHARDILCINYMCRRIHETIPPGMLFALRKANGAEMDLIFALHERVKGFIRKNTL